MQKGGFPRMGGGPNMQQLMKQAQKMQQDIQRAQEELNNKEFTATSGGGMVTVVVSGAKEVKSITINPECVDPEDTEMLQDLVLAAVNEALRSAQETTENELSHLTGGMNFRF